MGSIFQASHCNSFQDWVNFIFGCLIFWMWQGMRMMMPVMVAGWLALLSFNRDLWYIRSSSTMSQWYHRLYWYCFDPGPHILHTWDACQWTSYYWRQFHCNKTFRDIDVGVSSTRPRPRFYPSNLESMDFNTNGFFTFRPKCAFLKIISPLINIQIPKPICHH